MAKLSDQQREAVNKEIETAKQKGDELIEEGRRVGNENLLRKGIKLKNRAQEATELLMTGTITAEDIKQFSQEFQMVIDELKGLIPIIVDALRAVVQAIVDVLVGIYEAIVCAFPKQKSEAQVSAITPIETSGFVSFAMGPQDHGGGKLIISENFLPGMPASEIPYTIKESYMTIKVAPVAMAEAFATKGAFEIVQFYGRSAPVILPNGIDLGPNILTLDPKAHSMGTIDWETCEFRYQMNSQLQNRIYNGRSAIPVLSQGTGHLSFNPPSIKVSTEAVDFVGAQRLLDLVGTGKKTGETSPFRPSGLQYASP